MFRSLQSIIIAILGIALTILLFLPTAIVLPRANQAIDSFYTELLNNNMTTIRSLIRADLKAGDLNAVRRTVSEFHASKELDFIIVFTDGGLVLAASEIAWEGKNISGISEIVLTKAEYTNRALQAPKNKARMGSEVIDSLMSATTEKFDAGTAAYPNSYILARQNLSRIKAKINEVTRDTLLVQLLLTLVLLATAVYLIQKRLKTSIFGIVGTMQKVSAGDYSARSRLDQDDEIGSVGKFLDNMLSAIERDRKGLIVQKGKSQALLDVALDAVVISDHRGSIIELNQHTLDMFGFAREELVGKNVRTLMTGMDSKNHDRFINAYKSTGDAKVMGSGRETSARRRNGTTFPIYISLSKAVVDGEMIFVASMRDISGQVQANEEIHELAFTDKLTKLPNLTAFHNYIDSKINTLDDEARTVFALLEVDQFGDLNSTFGFSGGDKILTTVAERMQEHATSCDMIARVGADIFALCWTTTNAVIDPKHMVKSLLDYISVPIVVDTIPVRLSFNAGVLIVPEHTDDARYIMPFLSQALKQARKTQGQTIELFSHGLTSSTKNQTLLAQELKEALMNQELTIYLQPKVDLRTGLITGTESLLRWHRADGKFISPADFIPVAESSDLILDISRLVMRETFAFNKRWHEAGLPPIKTSLNISPPHLTSQFFHEHMMEDINAAGIEASTVECEVTETATMENREVACEALEKLREEGISISLDDFGTGHASLQYLTDLPVDTLKIDQSFVSNFAEDEHRQSIVRMIANLGDSLGMELVAEGIEQDSDAATLLDMGIIQGQGYHYARPMPVKEMFAINWKVALPIKK